MLMHSLALAFDTDHPEFARGVELGMLWQELRADPDLEVEQTVHVTNAEMALRVGEALGRPVQADEHDETWMTVRFGAAVETV